MSQYSVIDKIVDYIEEHLEEDLSLDKIADSLNYSKFYIARTFAEKTGTSIYKYIQGQATDIKIVSDHIQKGKERLNRILAENTGKTIEQITMDTERDNYMSAAEALEYGLIDRIIDKR